MRHSYLKSKSQFIPKNAVKYTGSYPINIKSSWERSFAQWLDLNESVISWSSENISIKYFDPVLNKVRRYYPDFFFKTIDKDNNLKSYLVEVKPNKETKPPTKSGRKSVKTIVHQENTYYTNMAKFDAASLFCKKMGYQFKLITEKELFRKNK